MFFNFIFHSNTRISRKSFEYCYFDMSREMPHSRGKWCSTSARLQQVTGWNTVRYQSSVMRPRPRAPRPRPPAAGSRAAPPAACSAPWPRARSPATIHWPLARGAPPAQHHHQHPLHAGPHTCLRQSEVSTGVT